MEFARKTLNKFYISNDEDVMLMGDGFEIRIKLSVIKCFVPVMQTALETPLNEERNNLQTRKSIQVSGFDKDTVTLFVKLLQQDEDKEMDLKWRDVVNLIKCSDYYQSKAALDICIELGIKLITLENVFEVITVIDQYNVDEWYEACIDVLLRGETMVTIQAHVRWNSALCSHSNVMVYILDGMHRIQRSANRSRQSMYSSPKICTSLYKI